MNLSNFQSDPGTFRSCANTSQAAYLAGQKRLFSNPTDDKELIF